MNAVVRDKTCFEQVAVFGVVAVLSLTEDKIDFSVRKVDLLQAVIGIESQRSNKFLILRQIVQLVAGSAVGGHVVLCARAVKAGVIICPGAAT